MQGINETKIKRSITRRNDISYIRGTISIRFLILFIIGIIIGGVVFSSSYIDRSALDAATVKMHFDSIFVGCETISDSLLTVLLLSELEIRYLFLIFISGFTYFCFIASGFMMLGRGFLLGFSSSCLIYLHVDSPETITRGAVVGFVIFNVIASFILIYLSVSAYIFSFDFRAIKRNHFVLRRAPIIYKYAFSLVLSLGGLLMNNLIYCIYFYFL